MPIQSIPEAAYADFDWHRPPRSGHPSDRADASRSWRANYKERSTFRCPLPHEPTGVFHRVRDRSAVAVPGKGLASFPFEHRIDRPCDKMFFACSLLFAPPQSMPRTLPFGLALVGLALAKQNACRLSEGSLRSCPFSTDEDTVPPSRYDLQE